MKELFEAENIYRLIKAHQKQEQFLKKQTRLEKSLTKFCGKKYLKKGLILYE